MWYISLSPSSHTCEWPWELSSLPPYNKEGLILAAPLLLEVLEAVEDLGSYHGLVIPEGGVLKPGSARVGCGHLPPEPHCGQLSCEQGD